MNSSIYDFDALDTAGRKVALSKFRGKAMLIVNTASACGFTPQFAGLETLHQAYGARGLAVLGFPCNQFGNQDPGSNDEITSFCQLNYGVSFPMMAKVDVNGAQATPLFQWLSAEAPGLLGSKAIKLISPNFWSAKTVKLSSATPRKTRQRHWPKTSRHYFKY